MNSTELYERFRLDVVDIEEPYLWSDTEVYGYMDAAQDMFCRLTYGIADASSPMTLLQAYAGEPFTEVSPRILKVRGAHLVRTGANIDLVNYEDVGRWRRDDYGQRSSSIGFSDRRGCVRRMVLGLEDDKVRWIDVPDVDEEVQLVIYRTAMPITDAGDEVLEIAPVHHLNLLFGMKARAYLKQDAETFDRDRAQSNAELFAAYCEQAKRDQELRRHKPRLMAYGGL